MILDFVLFFIGILGIFVFYIVLAHLSVRMGEGLGIPKYYVLYFIAILFLILAIPAGWSIYFEGNDGHINILFSLLTIGNIIAISVSYKYWWWLKNELWVKGGK
ncbi:MAG: hypothetical protein J5U17_06720 [Candidatus Methanoperedens sp.]|nr:hypothetical protein [Candidatus Methanoperedens sp.]MCE8425456.1 hypothetical protein [Candidatus Methanoperedens sp.]MCE8428616.1 hypothetical protein [Candidatus Methanoperedens sp.]